MSLNSRIDELEKQVSDLTAKLQDISRNTESTYQKPNSVVGGSAPLSTIRSTDIRSGNGNPVLWNNTETNAVYGTQPTTPTIGYNKHGHSRFSGGALIKDVTEIVEYDWGGISNKHSQGFFRPGNFPDIKRDINTLGHSVEKIGLLDLVFNPDTLTWGCPAYEIDVQKCFLIIRDENGDIALDENGNEMKSALYNEDTTKTSVVWDKEAQVWRLFAVFAPAPEV